MKLRRSFVLLAIAGALTIAIYTPAFAAPSPVLRKVLSSMKDLSDSQFANVVRWSRNGAPRPFTLGRNPTSEEWVEIAILDLNQPDRQAVLDWLRGNGRAALYARGASDSDIGNRRPANAGAAPTATPNPYRSLEFGSPTLNDAPAGNIAVFGGWAAVKRDGRAAHACISFKNVNARTATRLLVEFPISDDAGAELGKLELDRRGTFSPNIDIHGWDTMNNWQKGNNRGYDENCTGISSGMAALPLLAARFATYRILRVDYADGTSWTP